MDCASALSTAPNSRAAVSEVLQRVAASLGTGAGEPADLAVAFASPHHAEQLGNLAESIHREGLARHFLACTAESVLGESHEIERQPGLSLWAIRLPGATLYPLRIRARPTTDPTPWLEAIAGREATAIILGDPFSIDADSWLRWLREQAPRVKVVGGMASAGHLPGINRLALDGEVYQEGAVGILLDCPVPVQTVVSQGCRPIGQPFVITSAERNMIRALGGRPALAVLQELFETLAPEEQDLIRQGLHIGRVINEYQDTFHRGDFLVRNVLGADESGALSVTELVRVGQTVQFHVRDAVSAHEDLESLLAEATPASPGGYSGALLFSCNGRGTRLFTQKDHDVTALNDAIGSIPTAGFFAMGEIGPIGGQNFVHGFTASIALFPKLPV